MNDRCAYCDTILSGNPFVVTIEGLDFCNLACYEKWETQQVLEDIESDIKYTDYPELTGNWMIASDWHIPFHSTPWVMKLIEIADHFLIKNLIIPGDLINADEFAKYPRIIRPVSIEQEIEASQVLLKQLSKHFEQIVWLPGNHEARLAKFMNGTIETKDLLRMFVGAEEVRISRYPYAVIKGPNGETTGGQSWRITHPGNYSQQPTKVAQQICDRKMQNVLAGHGHMGGMAASPNLGFVAGDLCMMADGDKIAYRKLNDRIGPYWQNGFWMIRNGYGYLFWQHTDWDFWLGKNEISGHSRA